MQSSSEEQLFKHHGLRPLLPTLLLLLFLLLLLSAFLCKREFENDEMLRDNMV